MFEPHTYSPERVFITVVGPVPIPRIVGLARPIMVSARPAKERVRMVIGVDGEAASVFSNNMAGRIVIRVEEGSSSNLLLQTLRAFDHTTRVGVSAVYIKDQNSTLSQCMGINTRLTGPPDFTKAVQAGTVQWVFDAARLIPVQGGLRQA